MIAQQQSSQAPGAALPVAMHFLPRRTHERARCSRDGRRRDSSVAADCLRENGYDVVGIAMRLASSRNPRRARAVQHVASYEDFEDARRVAELMEFPFYVIDLPRNFSRAVMTISSRVLARRTPNPLSGMQPRHQVRSSLARARAFRS